MTSTGEWQLRPLAVLSPSEQSDVLDLVRTVGRLDEAEPLNEPAVLRLSGAEAGVSHVVATIADDTDTHAVTVGYAQVDVNPGESGTTAELVIGSVDDRAALADALLAIAEELAGSKDVLVWSRGKSPVGPAAAQRGYFAARTLLEMRRPLDSVPADRVWPPPGVLVRTFVPGQDDEDWLAVNAAAFADHPEQGHWTAADLAERIAQPWFDPRDFFLARDSKDGALLGFHWTKLHPPVDGAPPVGEVYVLGIAPAAQGRGIGRTLLDIGLRHLKIGPAEQVILYTEQDNVAAVRLYQGDGFTIARRDVQYRLPR